MKKILKQLIKKAGYNFIPIDSKFNIRHAFVDQKDLIGILDVKNPVIFDVGAYNGHTASNYKTFFPKSKVYCFEPSALAFKELVSGTKEMEDIEVYNFALGSKDGSSDFFVNSFGPTNSLLKPDRLANETWGIDLNKDTIKKEVDVWTLDRFVKEKGVSGIDILKMDTQGTELEILKGASEMIKNSSIKIIYMEIITLPTYENQPGLKNTMNALEDLGFTLFNLYNLSSKANGHLRQLDAIFINKKSFQNF
nr:FkbM family methyltransferase [Cytophagales bacterium]